MPDPLPRNTWLIFVLAWLVFLATSQGTAAACSHLFPSNRWLPQVLLKTLLAVAALVAAKAQGLSLVDLGFRAPIGARWAGMLGGGLGLGMAATVLVFASGSKGLSSTMKGYSMGQVILVIWLLSSVSEEVYCRGWFQAATLGADQAGAGWSQLIPSALLFASFHLGLLFMGVDLRSIAILVPLLFALGLLAAWGRAESTSLYPAIAAHIAFNVGGMVGGILFTISKAVITGELPAQP